MNTEDQEITKQEIKKEFQLERMILFSDAVFAIVITLMAIEIHLPEREGKYTESEFIHALSHISGTIFAYALSFFFIGMMWYKHLQMFSLLKDYNRGLVIRNLIFLFFIGLFPFGASLIVSKQVILYPAIIYFAIIMLCLGTQLLLQGFILNSKELIVKDDINLAALKKDLQKRTLILIAMVTIAILAYLTYLMIPDPKQKENAVLWFFVFVPIAIFINKRIGKKK